MRVLIVEDDPLLASGLADTLRREGYVVDAVPSAERAEAAIKVADIAIVILDIGLPGMDGFAVADRLAREVPVIMVTGEPEKARARDPKARVMAKPVAPDELERAVNESL